MVVLHGKMTTRRAKKWMDDAAGTVCGFRVENEGVQIINLMSFVRASRQCFFFKNDTTLMAT